MSADYRVIHGRFDRGEEPCPDFATALIFAQKVNGRVINADNVDVCGDEDCRSCNRTGLTKDEQDACDEVGL